MGGAPSYAKSMTLKMHIRKPLLGMKSSTLHATSHETNIGSRH